MCCVSLICDVSFLNKCWKIFNHDLLKWLLFPRVHLPPGTLIRGYQTCSWTLWYFSAHLSFPFPVSLLPNVAKCTVFRDLPVRLLLCSEIDSFLIVPLLIIASFRERFRMQLFCFPHWWPKHVQSLRSVSVVLLLLTNGSSHPVFGVSWGYAWFKCIGILQACLGGISTEGLASASAGESQGNGSFTCLRTPPSHLEGFGSEPEPQTLFGRCMSPQSQGCEPPPWGTPTLHAPAGPGGSLLMCLLLCLPGSVALAPRVPSWPQAFLLWFLAAEPRNPAAQGCGERLFRLGWLSSWLCVCWPHLLWDHQDPQDCATSGSSSQGRVPSYSWS